MMTPPKKINKNEGLKKRLFYFIGVFFMYALFSLSFVVAKQTLHYGGPFFMTGLRMILASLLLFLLQWLLDRKRMVSMKGHVRDLLLLSIFNIFFTNILEFWGLQFLSCYKTCYVYSLSPFVAAILSYFALKEKLSKMKLLGLLIALVGFAPLIIYKEVAESPHFYISPAEWALLGAVLATVTGWTVMRKLVFKHNYPPLMANAYSMFIGGILAFGTSGIFEGFHPVAVSSWKPFISGILIITLINNILGYNLYAFFTRKFTVTLMSFIGFVTPLITALLGWVFLSEPVTLFFFLSYLVVLIGFYLFSREELLHKVK